MASKIKGKQQLASLLSLTPTFIWQQIKLARSKSEKTRVAQKSGWKRGICKLAKNRREGFLATNLLKIFNSSLPDASLSLDFNNARFSK